MLHTASLPARSLRAHRPQRTFHAVALALATSLTVASVGFAVRARAIDAPGPVDPAGAALVAEADRLLHDDEDSERSLRAALDVYARARAHGLSRALEAHTRAHGALAFLRIGDKQRDDDSKVRLYEQGRKEAELGLKVDEGCADAWFYRGSNMGRIAQTRGVLQSLFLISDISASFKRCLKIQSDHVEYLVASGQVDEKVPAFAGGSTERAEASYRAAIRREPHFTRAMLDLAELLEHTGHKDEALQWARRARDEQQPMQPSDFRKFDKPRATKLVAALSS